jgi:hypothetical protein
VSLCLHAGQGLVFVTLELATFQPVHFLGQEPQRVVGFATGDGHGLGEIVNYRGKLVFLRAVWSVYLKPIRDRRDSP